MVLVGSLVLRGFGLPQVASEAGTYTLVWALSQAVFRPLSDQVRRRALASAGVLLQGLALWGLSLTGALRPAFMAAVLLGLGTGMAYPTLMAWVADVSAPDWRATALNVYRFWRDAGYAVGALGTGALAATLGAVAALTWTALGVMVLAWTRSGQRQVHRVA